MNKIVASVGLAALGASALQTASAQGIEVAKPAKPWTISATLRGFYDDNPSTLPDSGFGPVKKDSFGFEVSPSASFIWNVEQTSLSLSYLYSLKYYDNKPYGNSDHYDQTHTFNLALDHAFCEEYKIEVKDSFVIGQEPDMLAYNNTIGNPFRVPGNNIRNFGAIVLDGQVTREVGFEAGYDNGFYDYADDNQFNPDGTIRASNAGTLNRLEHSIHLDGRWTFTPETIGVAGFRFKLTDYTGDQIVGVAPTIPTTDVVSSDRNNRLYAPYVGVDHTFRPDLTGRVRVGANYADYYNDPTQTGNWSPYVMGSLHYVYTQDSYAELGFTYDRNTTDVLGITAVNNVAKFTVDAESAVVWGTISHSFTPHIFANLTGQYQNSTFTGGLYDNEAEQYYLVGLDGEYRFTPNFSAHVGYNYDKLQSNIPGRTYDRNRVYIGVTGSY